MKDMSITDFEVEGGEQVLGDKMNQPGTNEATGLKPDGTFSNNPSSEMLFDMLFNLPPADIKLGESIEKEVSFPVNAYGSTTAVVATKTITYQKDTTINGDPCAVLHFELHDSDLEKSVSFKKDSYGKYEGHGVTYFNLNKHEVEGAIGSILLDVFVHVDGDDGDCFGMMMEQTNRLRRRE